MSYADVKHIDVEQIPVIDIAGLFGDQPDYAGIGNQLHEAVTTMGFFYVKNHNVDLELMDGTFAMARQLFSNEQLDREAIRVRDYHRGLLSQGTSTMEGQKRTDLKESFIWGMDFPEDNEQFVSGNELMPPNRWPAEMPGLRKVLLDYLDQVHSCGKQLLRAFASFLEVDADYFIGQFRNPITRCTLIHYPPQPPSMGDDQYGVSPHTDYGTMTILAQDQTGGLRVRGHDGNWLTAHPVEGTLVVNVGDLLARWTNNRFVSTEHAVVNSSGKERYSIAVAMDPDWDTIVRPVVKPGETSFYKDVRCGDYIRGRFDRSFAYRH